MQSDRKKTRRRFGTILPRKLPSGTVVHRARWSEGRTGPRLERTFSSHREAAGFLADIEKKLVTSAYVTPPTASEVAVAAAPAPERGKPAFVGYATDLLEKFIAPEREEATATLYRANLKALRRYFGRHRTPAGTVPAVPLDGVTPARFVEYRKWRRSHRARGNTSKKVSNATLNRDLAFAVLVLGHAVRDGLLQKHPLEGLRRLREPRRKRRWLSDAEAETLLAACDPHFRPFVLAALLTGARSCELKALKWGDVHFDTGKIDIERRKTGSADALDLHPNLARALKVLKESRLNAGDDDFVFLNRYGRPWKDMRRAWKRALEAAGLEKREGLTPHSLRHTFATRFLQDGGAPRDLQAQLGHADLETTTIYSDLVDERRRKSVFSLPFGNTAATPKSCNGGGTGGGTTHSGGRVEEPRPSYGAA